MEKKEFEKYLAEFDATIIKLSKAYKIEPLEWEDTAQELRLWLWLRAKDQVSIKSFKDWAYITCKNKLVDLNRYWERQKRDRSKVSSLEEMTEKGFYI
jgi:DNA-directed RNA polymerase specialized sigma24 family protein